MEDHNRSVYVCSYTRYACVVGRDETPPPALLKKYIYISYHWACDAGEGSGIVRFL
jgi:hypothetical protein